MKSLKKQNIKIRNKSMTLNLYSMDIEKEEQIKAKARRSRK